MASQAAQAPHRSWRSEPPAAGFYVYVWCRANLQPFYIGKGKGDRWKSVKTRNPFTLAVLGKEGGLGCIPIFFLHCGTEAEAFAAEISLITEYGQRDFGGTLTNMTAGGDGAPNIAAVRENVKKAHVVVRAMLADSTTGLRRKLLANLAKGRGSKDVEAKKARNRVLESDIQRKIIHYAEHTYFAVVNKNDSRGNKGMLDLSLFFPKVGGRLLLLEVKRPGGVLTGLQKIWMSKLTNLQYSAAVVYSLEEGRAAIDEFIFAAKTEFEK